MQKNVPVLLLTGYLGSGKTTLLNHILTNERGIRFAVIVNDIGEVNIDASLIAKGGIVGKSEDSDDLVALQNGCICCTLRTDLLKQLAELVGSRKFDYIVIEASGICEPEPIAQTICSIPQLSSDDSRRIGLPVMDCIVTVVDALRLLDEFGCGDALTKKDLDKEDIENLIIEQIEFCNIILLNKISEVSPEEAEHIKAIIRAIQPKAQIIECDYCQVNLNRLINTGLFDFVKVSNSAAWIKHLDAAPSEEDEVEARKLEHHHHKHHDEHEHHHHHDHNDHECDDENCSCHHHHHHHGEGEAEEYGIQTFVYYRRQPFRLSRLDHFLAKNFPKTIIRTKGVIYFDHNSDMSYLFEQAGRQKKLTEAGYWFATAPKDELEHFMRTEPGLARDWDEKYGDRMIKLVIIGRNMDREAITAALDDCLGRF